MRLCQIRRVSSEGVQAVAIVSRQAFAVRRRARHVFNIHLELQPSIGNALLIIAAHERFEGLPCHDFIGMMSEVDRERIAMRHMRSLCADDC